MCVCLLLRCDLRGTFNKIFIGHERCILNEKRHTILLFGGNARELLASLLFIIKFNLVEFPSESAAVGS